MQALSFGHPRDERGRQLVSWNASQTPAPCCSPRDCCPCHAVCPTIAQFESAVEGSRLRRDLMADGGVAPVAASAAEAAAAAQRLGGVEERFAFARAVSRLYEMQVRCHATPAWACRVRGGALLPAAPYVRSGPTLPI